MNPNRFAQHAETLRPERDAAVLRLRQFDFLADSPQGMLETLAGAMRVRIFHAGELLWCEGDTADTVFFIEHGMAKLVRQVRDGVCRAYALFGPGDVLGLHTDDVGRCSADTLALSNGMTALSLPTRLLRGELTRYPHLLPAQLKEADRYVRACMDKIDIVSAGEVSQRLALLLRQLMRRYGRHGVDGTVILPFRLTLDQLGEIVDARQETLARILSRWQRQHWLSADRVSYRLHDIAALDALIQGSGSRGRRP